MSTIADLSHYCLSCPKPRCEVGCPTGNRIRDFIKALKEDNLSQAAEVLYGVNPFPELTSRLCDCARQCQGSCIRAIRQEPVQIQQIERYISDQVESVYKVGEAIDKKVALVGAGPANLAAAIDFLKAGYQIDVYEKLSQIGGAIYSGIPDYRFHKKYLQNIHQKLVNAGVHFFFEKEVGKDISLEKLSQDYDAVMIGIGAQVENHFGMVLPKGTVGGLSLLYDLNVLHKAADYQHYQKAVVWGGGNVAMDCARSLVRILKEVHVLYRRSENEISANSEEIIEAKKEGVQFRFLENIHSLEANEKGELQALRIVKMALTEKDASGRYATEVVANSEYRFSADLLVTAVGQKVDFSALHPKLDKKENHQSSFPNVFITGDAYLGPKNVAAAIHDGRKAAQEVISRLL